MQTVERQTWDARREHRLLIADGRVSCPLRGEVDLEICFSCRALVTVLGDYEPAYVACRPVGSSAAARA